MSSCGQGQRAIRQLVVTRNLSRIAEELALNETSWLIDGRIDFRQLISSASRRKGGAEKGQMPNVKLWPRTELCVESLSDLRGIGVKRDKLIVG